jgi:shikimate kinase
LRPAETTSDRPVIFLIGARGAGKSAVAQHLATKLGWRWLDADAVLEERFGLSIREIFAAEGEAGFRIKEAQILQELCQHEQTVIATGGGVVLRPDNRDCLGRGTVVWLKADADLLWERILADTTTAQRRPNLAQGGRAEIDELLRLRTPLYEACQQFTVDTSRQSAEQAADVICEWLQNSFSARSITRDRA